MIGLFELLSDRARTSICPASVPEAGVDGCWFLGSAGLLSSWNEPPVGPALRKFTGGGLFTGDPSAFRLTLDLPTTTISSALSTSPLAPGASASDWSESSPTTR